ELLPIFFERLARSAAFAGTEHEAWAIRQAYALAPTTDFSKSLLQECPPFLAVSQLPPMTWSDLGTPARLGRIFGTLGHRLPSSVEARSAPAVGRYVGDAQSA